MPRSCGTCATSSSSPRSPTRSSRSPWSPGCSTLMVLATPPALRLRFRARLLSFVVVGLLLHVNETNKRQSTSTAKQRARRSSTISSAKSVRLSAAGERQYRHCQWRPGLILQIASLNVHHQSPRPPRISTRATGPSSTSTHSALGLPPD